VDLWQFARVFARVVDRIAAGKGVIAIDDEDRENEEGLIFTTDSLTVSQMARMIRDGSGIVCLILTAARLMPLNWRQSSPPTRPGTEQPSPSQSKPANCMLTQ
jgi:3,4-dihydroxy-2-butanone 4-phosphate synthase